MIRRSEASSMITPHELKPWFVASMNAKNASLQRTSGTGYISISEAHKQIIKGTQNIEHSIHPTSFAPYFFHNSRKSRYTGLCRKALDQSQNEP